MGGNAHANRQRRRPSVNHRTDCLFCKMRPKEAKAKHIFRNSTGNRHNGHSKRRGKRPKKH